MDGWWPQGGHGTQQPGTSSPGGGGPRGRPPNGVGKAAAVTGSPVDASVVRAQLLGNFPPEAVAWVANARWVLADVPQDLVDDDDVHAWAASHDPARVDRFARQYRKDPGKVKPAVCVLGPGSARVKVIDGHHRDLGARQAGKPLRAYVGFVPRDSGPWDETHSYQAPKGGGDATKMATGYDLNSRPGMISLDLPDGLIEPLPGGVDDFHVTVVYLGPDVDDEAFAVACERAAYAAGLARGPLVGILSGIGSFQPSGGSDGKVPVFIPARIPMAERLRADLEDLSASEHADWKPHVTLAYLDEGDPLPAPLAPFPVTFTHLSVHRGDDEVRRFPLGG